MAQSDLAQQRIFAWLIDFLIALGIGVLFGAVGWAASTAYWLLRDGCFEGQSIGKRLMGLKVIVGQDRTRCTLRVSAIRNLLWIIPGINVVMGLTGLYALSKDRAGRHWGDRLADTRVVRA